MDITSLYNVSSGVIKNALQTEDPGKVNDKSSDAFGGFLSAAMDNITQANAYISDAEDEKVKLAMGETEKTDSKEASGLVEQIQPEAEDNSCLCAGRCDPDGFYCGICSDKTAIYTGCKL